MVPFAAVVTANCINIPLMRQQELSDGVPVMDADGNRLGTSRKAARRAIALTLVSRVTMALPIMCVSPVVMNHLEGKTFLRQRPYLASPIQIGLIGLILVFATPLCCALFPQTSALKVSSLESELQESIMKMNGNMSTVFFNKGL